MLTTQLSAEGTMENRHPEPRSSPSRKALLLHRERRAAGLVTAPTGAGMLLGEGPACLARAQAGPAEARLEDGLDGMASANTMWSRHQVTPGSTGSVRHCGK